MRIELLNTLFNTYHLYQFDLLFWPYTPPSEDCFFSEEDLDPEHVYDKDGIKITLEHEIGNAFITGLTPEEQTYLKHKRYE